MAKALLTTKRRNENGKRVIGFAEIWRINLAGISSEDHFGALANSRQNRLEGGGFKVLCFIDNHNLSVK